MPTSDYVPSRDAELALFLENYRGKLSVHGKGLGLTDAQIKAADARSAAVIAALAQNEKKLTEYKAQVAATQALKESAESALRDEVRLIKALPGYTEAIGRDLGIIGSRSPGASAIDPTLKAEAVAEVHKGFVRIKWRKGRFDGVNVYTRRQGEAEWRLLGRDNTSPFDDSTPLAQPGFIEVREYRVIGVAKDVEVSQPSDILSISFAG